MRFGYGSGSVATGAFGTVPGLMLLPYLTDELGIAAIAAGFIVFLPKAWDVVLNPIAGRISDRTEHPDGPRRPWLIKAGVMLAGAFALIFAAPDMGSRVGEAAWVLLFFVLAATAYAFFQVPYVAMPAEITWTVDRHDPPPRMAETVRLRDETCVFPRCGRHARGCDLDHITPYDDDAHDDTGPPGRTTHSNTATLCRRHHRSKTSGAWTYERLDPGTYLWHGPAGLTILVTPDDVIDL